MHSRLKFIASVLAGAIIGTASTETNATSSMLAPSSNAPKDQPVHTQGKPEMDELESAVAPYVAKARQTYPDAKKRYLEGLPPGQAFFVVTTLRDRLGAIERVFVSVGSIRDARITGRIANEILSVHGYKEGDLYTFPEREVIDWVIPHPDGTEEGNVVGKFLDKWQKTRQRR